MESQSVGALIVSSPFFSPNRSLSFFLIQIRKKNKAKISLQIDALHDPRRTTGNDFTSFFSVFVQNLWNLRAVNTIQESTWSLRDSMHCIWQPVNDRFLKQWKALNEFNYRDWYFMRWVVEWRDGFSAWSDLSTEWLAEDFISLLIRLAFHRRYNGHSLTSLLPLQSDHRKPHPNPQPRSRSNPNQNN